MSSGIDFYLRQIATAVYGQEVRWSIYHAIERCYDDIYTSKTIADDSAAAASAAADAANEVADTFNDQFAYLNDEMSGNLYSLYEAKDYINVLWESGNLSNTTGSPYASTTAIRTGYLRVYSSLAVEVTPPEGVECMLYAFSAQQAGSETFRGNPLGKYASNSQRYTLEPDTYFRIVARYVNGGDIQASVGSSIGLVHYVSTDNGKLNTNDISSIVPSYYYTPTWQQGGLSIYNGGLTDDYTTNPPTIDQSAIRTGYLRVRNKMTITVDVPEGMVAAVLGYGAQTVNMYTGPISDGLVDGKIQFQVEPNTYFKVMVKYANGNSILPELGETVEISYYNADKELNILVLGNSFSMDSFAYLPPVLNELLKQYVINYGVAYKSSASISDHVTLYNNNQKYTLYYEWNRTKEKWIGYTSTGQYAERGKTLTDIMALRDWDIIYVQPASNVTSEQNIVNNIINPGRQLLRILQNLTNKPFTFLMGEWLGTDLNGDHGDEVFEMIANAMLLVSRSLGIDGVIPIGAAIQDARTISSIQSLGETGNMLYDGQHMQSGIAPLIASYTIALYIARMVGGTSFDLYGSTFEPTTANCTAINAYHTGNPTPMTHGESVGTGISYYRAGQEIATIANNYPFEIINCSNFFV